MKKYFSLILCLCLVLSLAACGNNGEADTGTTSNTIFDLGETTKPAEIQELNGRTKCNGFNFSMLPPGFPDYTSGGIETISMTKYTNGSAEYGYDMPFTRLRLRLSEEMLRSLSHTLAVYEWSGGVGAFAGDENTVPSLDASWVRGENQIAIVSSCDYDETNTEHPYTVSLDITESDYTYNSVLKGTFPELDTRAIGNGELKVYKKDKTPVTDYDSLDGLCWVLSYSGKGALRGLDYDTMNGYLHTLEDNGFEIDLEESVDDNGSTASIICTKPNGTGTFAVEFMYYNFLETADAVFTNNYTVAKAVNK